MGIQLPVGQRREVVLRALLSLMLAFAPLLAQVAMSGHAAATVMRQAIASANLQSNTDHVGHAHTHDHGDAQAGTGHNHDTLAAAVPANSDHDHGPTLNFADSAPCPNGHGNHDSGSDTGCCGTFCHSAIAILTVPRVRGQHGAAAFISFFGMPTDSVVPDQPHRPPSVLVSL
jgi:hypothetical protein